MFFVKGFRVARLVSHTVATYMALSETTRAEGKPKGITGECGVPADKSPTEVDELMGYSVGKQVRGELYLHVSALGCVRWAIRKRVEAAARLADLPPYAWNVAKLQISGHKLSLLEYLNFFEDPFPMLCRVWSVDVEKHTVQKRRYDPSGNPPILHRKELLLPLNGKVRNRAEALSLELERRGLLNEPALVGFRRHWEERLARAGVEIRNHEVVEVRGK